MQFRPSVFELAQPQNVCHVQTDRHFVKIVKSCSEHPNTYKSIKKPELKIFGIPVLPFYIVIEESKNEVVLNHTHLLLE